MSRRRRTTRRLDGGDAQEVRRRDRLFALLSVLAAALLCAALPRTGESEPTAGALNDGPAGQMEDDDPVAPEAAPAINFSHGRHSEVPCRQCHQGAFDSTRTADDLRPSMTACADCHDEPDEGPKPPLNECSACHIGYDRTVDEEVDDPEDWRAVRPAPMIPPRPAATVSFDHASHISVIEQQKGIERADMTDSERRRAERKVCADCHRMTDGQPRMPTMGDCRSCHGDQKEAGRLKPANHTVAWEKRHGRVARSNPNQCEDCHTEDDCASCHNEQQADPFSVHPPNFDTLHAVDARSNIGDCADCHTVETFCRQCHARTKFVPDEPNRPPSRFSVHPPGWSKPGSPGNHAAMARRNIEDCASCHTEDDCVACHQGVNPHPPEFQLRCKQWLQANPAPCAKCHGNVSSLRGQCL